MMGQDVFVQHYWIFLNGLFFFILAVYSFSMPKGSVLALGWSWNRLGLFGLCFGLFSWNGIIEEHIHLIAAEWLNAGLAALGGMAIFEFGRYGLRAKHSVLGGAWAWAMPLAVGAVLAAAGRGWADPLVWKAALAFPGSLMAAGMLLLSARGILVKEGVADEDRPVRRGLLIAAAGLLALGIVFAAGVVPFSYGAGIGFTAAECVLVFVVLFAMTLVYGRYVFDRLEDRWTGFWGKYRGYVYLFLLVTVLIGGFLVVGKLSRYGIVRDYTELEISSGTIKARLLGEVRIVRSLAWAMAQSPSLRLVVFGTSEADKAQLNVTLDRYAGVLEGAVCYVLDLKGQVIASSNRAEKDSFVGKNYAVRPYFKQALVYGVGEYAAMGLTSKISGFYASVALHAVDGALVGVAVIKAPLGSGMLEGGDGVWSLLVHTSGIILAASLPELEQKSLWPLQETARQELLVSKQFPVPDGVALTVVPPESGDIRSLLGEEALFLVRASGLKDFNIVMARHPRDFDLLQLWSMAGLFFLVLLGGVVTLWNELIQRNRILTVERARRQAELAMQMEVVFNSAQVGLMLVDSAFRVKKANQVILDLGGHQLSDVIGRPHGDALSCIQADKRPDGCGSTTACQDCAVRGTVLTTLKTGQAVRGVEVKRTIRTSTGEHREVWLEINATSLEISGEPHVLFSMADITQRQEAARVLEISEQKYRTLFEEMVSGFAYHELVLDSEGKPVDYITLQVNKAYERMTGLARESIIGQRVYASAMPGLDKEWLEIFSRVALTGKSAHYVQYSVKFKKWFEGAAFSTRRGFFAVTFVDVTEQKRVEEERARTTKELEIFYKASIGREERILQLKQEVDQLKREMALRKS